MSVLEGRVLDMLQNVTLFSLNPRKLKYVGFCSIAASVRVTLFNRLLAKH